MTENAKVMSAGDRLFSRAHMLGVQLARANTHLHLFCGLLRYCGDFGRAKDFWDYTLTAHSSMAIRNLSVIYDTHRDGMNLLNLVKSVDVGGLDETNVGKRDSFLMVVRKENADPQVQVLRDWRNNVVAHFNEHIACSGREEFCKRNPLDEGMLQVLIDRGFEIVDWCAKIGGRNSPFQRFVEGKDGYRLVVAAVKIQKRAARRRARGL
jgi:hypothetical protein